MNLYTISHFVELDIFGDKFCKLNSVAWFSTDQHHKIVCHSVHLISVWKKLNQSIREIIENIQRLVLVYRLQAMNMYLHFKKNHKLTKNYKLWIQIKFYCTLLHW